MAQPTTYSPWHRGFALVGDQATAALVDGDVGERRAAVAAGAEGHRRGDLDALVGGARRAAKAVLEPAWRRVAGEQHRLHGPVAAQLDGGEQEAQHDAARVSVGRAGGVAAQDLDVASRRRAGVGVGDPVGERELVGVDDHVRVGELAELEQLGVGEGRLLGAAAGDHEDLADLAAPQLLERVVGDVGERELVMGEDQHARDVQRDVAGADHDRALAGEVEAQVAEVGMAVVPADEVPVAE